MNSKWHISCGHYIGKKHERANHVCEDNTLCLNENGVQVIVVSDGSGSKEFAYYGSLVTVDAVANLFVNHFDVFYNENNDELSKRKIVEHILSKQLDHVEENSEIYQDYIEKNKELFEKHEKSGNLQGFYLRQLHATLLFVAAKGDKIIYGRIGDGTIGAIVNNKLKIISEEEKGEDISGTYYPEVLHRLFSREKNPYDNKELFTYIKTDDKDVSGFVLLSDGSDVIINLNIPFQKSFRPIIDDVFKSTVILKNQEEKNARATFYAQVFADRSRTNDDCSVAILVKEDYQIDEFEIKHLEIPSDIFDDEEKIIDKETELEAAEIVVEEKSKFEINSEIVLDFDSDFYNELSKIVDESNEIFENIIAMYASFIKSIKEEDENPFSIVEEDEDYEELKYYLYAYSKKYKEGK